MSFTFPKHQCSESPVTCQKSTFLQGIQNLVQKDWPVLLSKLMVKRENSEGNVVDLADISSDSCQHHTEVFSSKGCNLPSTFKGQSRDSNVWEVGLQEGTNLCITYSVVWKRKRKWKSKSNPIYLSLREFFSVEWIISMNKAINIQHLFFAKNNLENSHWQCCQIKNFKIRRKNSLLKSLKEVAAKITRFLPWRITQILPHFGQLLLNVKYKQ